MSLRLSFLARTHGKSGRAAATQAHGLAACGLRLAEIPLRVSAIDVDDARLWGLSLMMVDELARAAGLKVPAP